MSTPLARSSAPRRGCVSLDSSPSDENEASAIAPATSTAERCRGGARHKTRSFPSIRARATLVASALARRAPIVCRSVDNEPRPDDPEDPPAFLTHVPRISRESSAKLAPLSALVRQHNNCTAGCAGGCSHHRTQQLNCFISGPDTHVRIALYHSTRLMTTRPPRLPPRLSISQLLVLLHTRSRSICTYAPDPPCTFP